MRYEDDFGSFWMVDDNEFVKRRHLSRGRPRKYDPSPSPTSQQQQQMHQPTNSQQQQQSTNSTSSNTMTNNNSINHHYFPSTLSTQ